MDALFELPHLRAVPLEVCFEPYDINRNRIGAVECVRVVLAGYCITLVIFGAAFGIIWQGRGEAGVSLTAEMPSPPISKPVACLSFLFIGALWGSLASYFLHSAIAAASALVASVVSVGLWYPVCSSSST